VDGCAKFRHIVLRKEFAEKAVRKLILFVSHHRCVRYTFILVCYILVIKSLVGDLEIVICKT
jgi:hypothetical protein